MNKLAKYTLIAMGLNILSLPVFLIPVFLFDDGSHDGILGGLLITVSFVLLSLISQLITAFIYLGNDKKRTISFALLLSLSILLISGFTLGYFI